MRRLRQRLIETFTDFLQLSVCLGYTRDIIVYNCILFALNEAIKNPLNTKCAFRRILGVSLYFPAIFALFKPNSAR